MPRVGLFLPGERRQTTVDVSETYRITVERDDGVVCSEIEAFTAMQLFCSEFLKRRRPARAARKNNQKTSGKDIPFIAETRRKAAEAGCSK